MTDGRAETQAIRGAHATQLIDNLACREYSENI